MPRPVQQQEQIPSLPPGALQPDDVARRSTAAAAAALAAAAAEEEAAAAGGSAAPLDSWGSSFVSSDEESEQLAKQRVIELLSHPAETELLLLAEAEAQQRQQGSADSGGLSVSPEYIDALVHAVQDPSVGMPHREALIDSDAAEPRSTPSAPAVTDPLQAAATGAALGSGCLMLAAAEAA
eukprot:gene11852-11996_t